MKQSELFSRRKPLRTCCEQNLPDKLIEFFKFYDKSLLTGTKKHVQTVSVIYRQESKISRLNCYLEQVKCGGEGGVVIKFDGMDVRATYLEFNGVRSNMIAFMFKGGEISGFTLDNYDLDGNEQEDMLSVMKFIVCDMCGCEKYFNENVLQNNRPQIK